MPIQKCIFSGDGLPYVQIFLYSVPIDSPLCAKDAKKSAIKP